MAGIIEIWRREAVQGLPVRFTVGNPPVLADENAASTDLIVKHIDFRESGSMAGKRLDKPVFCITFEESFVQRFIPADEVVDIAYETKQAAPAAAPPLET